MVRTQNLTMRFGSRILFEDINIKLDQHKRYGLIGANGAGKTTFLKILSGEIKEYEGEVIIGSGLKVGVLGQNQYAYEDFTIMDAVLYGNKRLYDAVKEKEELYTTGDFEDDKVNERLGELEMICVEEDPTYEYEIQIAKILENVGIPAEEHYNLMSSLKTSDKFKVLLAQVLFPKPDVLFLDEPTNNLDIESIGWLENELQRHEGTMVVISHDRHFLNAVVTNILDVDYQKIREFTGNYDDWYIASTVMAKQLENDNAKKLKEKADLEAFVRRFSANASKAKQATSRQKQLDKLNIEDIKPSSRRDPSIVFKAKRQMGDEALWLEGVSHSYDDLEVLKDMTIRVEPGEKIALIGRSGCGKSTLLHMLAGLLIPSEGCVRIHGHQVSKPSAKWNMMFQKPSLYPWMNVRQNAELGLVFNGQRDPEKIDHLLATVGLSDKADAHADRDGDQGHEDGVGPAEPPEQRPHLPGRLPATPESYGPDRRPDGARIAGRGTRDRGPVPAQRPQDRRAHGTGALPRRGHPVWRHD